MSFLIRIITSSIIGVVLGLWVARKLNFTPKNLKRKYNFLIQAIYTAVLTIVLTFLDFEGAYLGWVILIALSFLTWLFSAKLANFIARNKGESLQRESAVSPSS